MNSTILARSRTAVAALRDRHRRLTLIGAPLVMVGVPLILVGGLGWALHDPASAVDQVPAAVVNNDEPVTVNGRLVPLGRELTARLVDSADPNYRWTLTSAADAKDGLDSGRYRIAVTIPADFSQAATSPQQGPDAAHQAAITVTAAKNAPLTDAAVGQRLLDQTRTTLGREVTRTYLENVYVGLNDMHAKLSDAAAGAQKADDGAHQLATGATDLATGAATLDTGLAQLSDGAATLAAGTGRLASGATSLHAGATSLASGSDQVAAGNRQLAAAVDPVATRVITAIDQAPDVTAAVRHLEQVAAGCSTSGASAQFCAQLTRACDQASAHAGQLSTALRTVRGRVVQLRTGVDQLATGSAQVARGAHTLSTASGQLATGARQAAAGASTLDQGVRQAHAGSGRLRSGAEQLARGAQDLARGTAELHQGLATAVTQVPTYTQAQRTHLAQVVAEPITADGHGFDQFARQSMTLFAVVALWVAAMSAFALFRAVPATVLRSHRPTWQLALTGAVEPAVLGTVAALLVGTVVAVIVSAGPGRGLLLCAAAVATAGAFQVLHRAVATTIPRHWLPVSVAVLVLTVAASVTSAQPPLLQSLASYLPTTAGVGLIRAAMDGSLASLGHAALVLLTWYAAGLLIAMIRTEKARTTSVRELVTSARLREPVRV